MTIRVLLFGHYRDGLSAAERTDGIALEMPVDATPADVAAYLAAENLQFADLLKRTRIAVGAEFASSDMRLADGDEVAFLPPMSGG